MTYMTSCIQSWKSGLDCRPASRRITVFKNITLSSWALLLSITTLTIKPSKQFSFKISLMRSGCWWFLNSSNSWLRYTSWTNFMSEFVIKLWMWNMPFLSAVHLVISNLKAATIFIFHTLLLINCPHCHFSDQACHQPGTVHSCGSHNHQQSYFYYIWQLCLIIIEWSWETVSSQQQLVLLLQKIKPLTKQLLSEAHYLYQWNHVSNTSARSTGNWDFLNFYKCLWTIFRKWTELLNYHLKDFKSILRILNINHQNYAAEIMMPDHFNLQCMLIYNESIPTWTLINISATGDAFIDFFFSVQISISHKPHPHFTRSESI